MKYFYTIIPIAAVVMLQLMSERLSSISKESPREGVRSTYYRVVAEDAIELPPADFGLDEPDGPSESERPYGLHYSRDENSWTLFVTVQQLKETSIYGRPGEIAQIEYSLDGHRFHSGWIVLKIDNYSFVDETSEAAPVETGHNLKLYVSGEYVSAVGVDWEKCPDRDIYCRYASFVEGGFPKSEDYDGLTLCPSNTLIQAGFLPDDWINGMLAWRVNG